jgi:uncharacterized protein YdaU (DUF1376 family)
VSGKRRKRHTGEPDIWVRFFPDKWLAGTRELSAAETGVYITLIARMYESNGYVVRDDARLARLCGCPVPAFRRALQGLLNKPDGLVETADGLTNQKVLKELVHRRQISDAGAAGADARWNGKDNKNNDGSHAVAVRSQYGSNANQNQNNNPQTPAKRGLEIDLKENDGPIAEAVREIERHYGTAAVNSWFGKCELNGTRVCAPNQFTADYLKNHYGQFLRDVEITVGNA